MNLKQQYTKEALRYFNTKLQGNDDQYSLYFLTITPDASWMKMYPFQKRLELIESLAYRIIQKFEAYLFKNRKRKCNSRKRLDPRTVVECRSRYGVPTFHHAHMVVAVHSSYAHKFNQGLVEKIKAKAKFEGFQLEYALHSIDFKHIEPPECTEEGRISELEKVLDYMFKHAGDQKNPEWDVSWSYF